MSAISMNEALRRLRANYRDVTFDGGNLPEGFWISAHDDAGHWSWVRHRMASPGAALSFAQVAMAEFYGA